MFFRKRKIKNLCQNKTDQCGFTLMEVLVSTSIFVILLLASLSIYTATLKASQKTTALVRIQQEVQFIVETLTKKVRSSKINYAYYGVTNPLGESILAVTDLAGDEYYFKQIDNAIAVAVNPTTPSQDGEYIDMPTINVSIIDLNFFVSPSTDPFATLDEPPASQPYVTIVIDISSTKAAQTASLTIQQTVPQRSGNLPD